MENIEQNESPTPVTPTEVKQPLPKKMKPWLVPLVVFLGILFLTVAGYIVYTEFFLQEDVDDDTEVVIEEENDFEVEDVEIVEDEEEEEEMDEETSYSTFDGEVISAQLPEGWGIIEYFNGEGTDSLPGDDIDYSGLTAIDIVSPDNRQVFTIQAVSGIGFIGCPQYALFDDDNPGYQAEQQNASDEMGETLNILDYTDKDYIEFEFLDTTFRRIGDKYYYDTKEGNNYFEPPCVEGLLTLEGLYFTDESGFKYEAYFYGGTEDATLEDLEVVDEILESVELI
jgi:hypothetical protein